MKKLFATLLFFHILLNAFSQTKININTDFLPQIQKLSSTDVVFKQFEKEVLYNEKVENNEKNSEEDFEFGFYIYIPQKKEDLIDVASFSGIPYDTISTLNSINNSSENIEGKKLILPTVKGIFIAENPKSAVEILVYEEYASFVEKSKNLCYNLNGRNFYFLCGKRFSPAQRAYFLDSSMLLPLKNVQITSKFGYRDSPIYKRWKFHNGIDFAAKEGTEVFACKSGKVATVLKNDPTFGNCIVLSHEKGLTSVYAHLSKINVKKGDIIQGGKVIGLTGKSGAVTGPHLHFEVRENGKATNPLDYLDIS